MEPMMHDTHLNRIFKLGREKGMNPKRWTHLLANPVFAAILDSNADLSNVEGIMDALNLPFSAGSGLITRSPVKMEMPAEQNFAIREKFVRADDAELPVKFDAKFEEAFLNVVETVPAGSLRRAFFGYERQSDYSTAAGALGGTERLVIPLAHVYHFLKNELREYGFPRHWYVFFVKDSKGVVRSLMTYWNNFRWDLAVDENEPYQKNCHHMVEFVVP